MEGRGAQDCIKDQGQRDSLTHIKTEEGINIIKTTCPQSPLLILEELTHENTGQHCPLSIQI